jgi:hypothetical protein
MSRVQSTITGVTPGESGQKAITIEVSGRTVQSQTNADVSVGDEVEVCFETHDVYKGGKHIGELPRPSLFRLVITDGYSS